MTVAHTSSLVLWPWVKLAVQMGLGLEATVAACGLSEGELRDPAGRIAQSRANELAERVSLRFGPGAPMAAAYTVEAGHFSLVETAVRSAPTVAEGLDLFAELFPLLHDGGRIEHGRTRNSSIVRYSDLPGTHMHPAYTELLFAVGLQGLRRETGAHVQATAVTFMHLPQGEHPLYRELLGENVRFGARTNSFALSATDAALPLLRANRRAQLRAMATAEESLPARLGRTA